MFVICMIDCCVRILLQVKHQIECSGQSIVATAEDSSHATSVSGGVGSLQQPLVAAKINIIESKNKMLVSQVLSGQTCSTVLLGKLEID